MAVNEDLAGLLDVPGLVAVKAHRIDQPFNPCDGDPGHGVRGPGHPKQAGGCGGGHRIARLRREHRRNQHLEGVFLAGFGDLLDCGQLQVVDGACQRAHDGPHSTLC